MTAIGGFWTIAGSDAPEDGCRRILRAQQIYAPADPDILTLGDLSIGKRLFPTVPEDRFDTGIQECPRRRWLLVADARIDNRAELGAQLGIAAERAARLSDADFVLEALIRWDLGAIDRLIGDFAFAAWDRQKRQLVLARDALGQRPLHYARRDGWIAFSSMPKGLLALPQVDRTPNAEVATRFLALLPDSTSETFYAGIEKVLPGHYCIVDTAGVRSVRHWNPSRTEVRLDGPEAYAEAVRALLDTSVRARLRGAGDTVGSQLSGGLDSTIVTATAARIMAETGGRVTAFTGAPAADYDGKPPPGRLIDESALAATVAAQYPNVEHIVSRSQGRSPFAGLDRNFHLYDRPSLNTCAGTWGDANFDLAKAHGLRVLLNGQMGNMTISYDGFQLLPQLVAQGRLLALARHLRQLKRGGKTVRSSLGLAIGPFVPAGVWRRYNRLRGRQAQLTDYTALRPDVAAALERDTDRGDRDLAQRPHLDAFAMRMWVLERVDQGNYNKGFLGGWGIDYRDPTADRRLVEFCLSVPLDQYLRNGTSRALARTAFADRIPAAVLAEKRSGTVAADWHVALRAARAEGLDEFARITGYDGSGNVLDIDRMQALFDAWPDDGWESAASTDAYRLTLLRGISVGHFLRKAAGSNA